MVTWQVTATTVHCHGVDDDVTLLVYKDGSAKCTGYSKYGKSSRQKKLTTGKEVHPEKPAECEGPECPLVIQYRDKLFAEEAQEKV